MNKLTCKLKGKVMQDPKVSDDGTCDLIFKIDPKDIDDLPKLAKPKLKLGFCIVHLSKNMYVKNKEKLDQELEITGYLCASLNGQGKPFIQVVADSLTTTLELETTKNKVVDYSTKGAKVVNIPLDSIVLYEDIHFSDLKLNISSKAMKNIGKTKRLDTPIVVRKLGNDKFGLIFGMSRYILAKIHNVKLVPCVIENKGYNQLAQEYGVNLEKPKPKKPFTKKPFDKNNRGNSNENKGGKSNSRSNNPKSIPNK